MPVHQQLLLRLEGSPIRRWRCSARRCSCIAAGPHRRLRRRLVVLVIPIPGTRPPSRSRRTVWVTAAGSQAVWPIDPAPAAARSGPPDRRRALAVGRRRRRPLDRRQRAGGRHPDPGPAGTGVRSAAVGADITDVALADDAVWVVSSAEGLAARRSSPVAAAVATLPVGAEPVDVAAGGRWVVVAAAAGRWRAIDAGTRTWSGHRWCSAACRWRSPSGDTAWVADACGGTVTQVDLARASAPVRRLTSAAGRSRSPPTARTSRWWPAATAPRAPRRRERGAGSRAEVGGDPIAVALDERTCGSPTRPGTVVTCLTAEGAASRGAASCSRSPCARSSVG